MTGRYGSGRVVVNTFRNRQSVLTRDRLASSPVWLQTGRARPWPKRLVFAERMCSRGQAGRTIVVTDHGRPVARIIPEAASLQERVDALRKAGAIGWSGRRSGRRRRPGKVRGTKTVADLVVEKRG
jgi:antitoxin (DNA-binding transcriptional repressor) of toxin-antitoxin stability system